MLKAQIIQIIMTKRTVLHSRSFIGAAAKLACLMLFVGAAHADTDPVDLTLNGPLNSENYVYYTFTGDDGLSHSNYVAPYPSSITEGESSTAAFSICLDINNSTYVGQQYSGHWDTALPNQATLETTFLANLLNLELNKKARPAVEGAISYAIWDIMFPSSTDSEGGVFVPDPAAAKYETLADQMVTGGWWTVQDSSHYPIFIPTDTTAQRFAVIFTDPPPVIVPEPGELTLLSADLLSCSGLLVLALLWRRRVGHSG
jgi:hypothetical protein